MLAELVDREYSTIVSDLKSKYKNIDPFLLVKSAMLRRKYPEEEKQTFWLDLFFKEGIDEDKKKAEIFQKVGMLLAAHGHGHYKVNLQATLETILSLAEDSDIERMEGEVFPLW